MVFNRRETAGFRTAGTEQQDSRHIKESTSPWKSPVFVVKRKSGKQRMVTYLKAVCKVIQLMGPLQSGVPLPSLLPKGWPLVVIDLNDFSSLYLYKEMKEKKIAFTVPTNNSFFQLILFIMYGSYSFPSLLSSHSSLPPPVCPSTHSSSISFQKGAVLPRINKTCHNNLQYD